jgi:hypothetical protein
MKQADHRDDVGPTVSSRLGRLRLALVDRDWIAIGIELVVVTLGVMLAFEAQQWGEQRSRQREERDFLERLYRETGDGADELQELVRIHQRGVTELGAVLRAKDNPALLAQYAHEQNFGCVIGTLPTAAFNDTASEEMFASGRISMISDPKLRDAVRRLAAEQAEGERQLAYARQVSTSVITASLPYNRYELVSGDTGLRCTIDWPSMVADPSSAAALARTYRIHQLMLEIRQDTLTATAAVREKLACTLAKPECRH